MWRFAKPRALYLLEALPYPRLLAFTLLGLSAGLLLPYAFAGDFSEWTRGEYFRFPPGRREGGLSLVFFLESLGKNLLVLFALTRLLPWVEGTFLPNWPPGGWVSRLYLLLVAPVTGVLASPFGLPHGGGYLLTVAPLALGEFATFTAAACWGRRAEGRGALALLLLALYETWAAAYLL